MTKTRSLLFPAMAVAVGGLAAVLFVAIGSSSQGTTSAPVAPVARAPAESLAPLEADEPGAKALSGNVLERIAVQKYTYLRIGEAGSEGTWVAVPAAEVKVGERVSVRNAQRMTDFQSPTLKRTFSTIYFGELDRAEEGSSAAHALGAERANPHAGLSDGTDVGAATDAGALPGHHMTPHEAAGPVDIGKVAKAPGPLGRTVAEIYAERAKLNGKKIRVRGIVVKSVANVLDRTFIHLRDGTGSAGDDTHDLTITASTVPHVGDKLLYEGTLAIDKDYGSGYRYRAVLQDATVLAD